MKSDPSLGAKVEYVLAQPQVRAHHCHWPGCDSQVPPAKWGCTAHWFALPKGIRSAIWKAYRPGQELTQTPSRAYMDAAKAAQEWIAQQARNEPPAASSTSAPSPSSAQLSLF